MTWKKYLPVALCLVSLLPAFVLVPHVLRTWEAFPYYDDWITPGRELLALTQGRLTIGKLFLPHNESRPFFPRLVLILLDRSRWDARKGIAASFLMVCLASLLLRRLLGKLRGVTAPGKLVMLLLVNAVLFWPNSEIWSYADTFMMVWPPAMLLCALLVNLSGAPLRKKVLLNSLFATVATYSWSNGMLLWVFAFPLPGAVLVLKGFRGAGEKREARWYLFYALACAINLGFYFHDFKHGVLSWDLPRDLDYFFTWLGAFFGDFQQAKFLGRCVFAAYAALAGSYMYIAGRRRDFTDGYPWLISGFYSIASGILTSMGRAGLGMEQAMSPRYTEVSGYTYIAIAGLGCLAWRFMREEWSSKRMLYARFAAGAMAGLLMPVVIVGYQRGFAVLDETNILHRSIRCSWQWSEVIPRPPDLYFLHPSSGNDEETEALGNSGLLKAKRWEPGVAANWNFEQTAVDNRNGILDICTVLPGANRLLVEGWSRLPGRSGPADYVLVTVSRDDAAPSPFLMLPPYGESRPDVASAFKDKGMLHSGFRKEVDANALPPGRRVTVRAWAVDMERGTVSPLANSFVLEAGHN